MDKFLKYYHGKTVEDDGAYMSKEAKSFFRKMKNYVNRCLPNYTIKKWHVGHYHVSFFLVKEREQPILYRMIFRVGALRLIYTVHLRCLGFCAEERKTLMTTQVEPITFAALRVLAIT